VYYTTVYLETGYNMKKLLLIILTFSLLSTTAIAIPPPDSYFEGSDCTGITDVSPEYGADDISQQTQTCVNITVPSGCTVNVSFIWFNETEYNHQIMMWWISGGVIPYPDFYDWDFWTDYAEWDGVNSSTQLCATHNNISCSIFGYYGTNHWLINTSWNCSGEQYNRTCYSYFNGENCSLFYIYPSYAQQDVCPCCDSMCFGISNAFGNPMNVTVYRNDTINESFYIVNKYINITNGTYCFCIDGHVDDIYYPVRSNETYFWYINVTDTVMGNSQESDIFFFSTASDLEDCCFNRTDIIDITQQNDNIKDDSWIMGFIIIFTGLILYILLRKR